MSRLSPSRVPCRKCGEKKANIAVHERACDGIWIIYECVAALGPRYVVRFRKERVGDSLTLRGANAMAREIVARSKAR